MVGREVDGVCAVGMEIEVGGAWVGGQALVAFGEDGVPGIDLNEVVVLVAVADGNVAMSAARWDWRSVSVACRRALTAAESMDLVGEGMEG